MNLNLGYIILSPENNIGGLKNTIRSIKNNHGDDCKTICVVNSLIKPMQLKEMKEVCDTYKGGKTITSLINKGFEKIDCEWGVILTEGSRTCKNLLYKYEKWATDERDILFPLVVDYDINWQPKKIYDSFHDCTLNGICMNKKFFHKIGKIIENDSLEISRKVWMIDAIKQEAKFKSILGIKIC